MWSMLLFLQGLPSRLQRQSQIAQLVRDATPMLPEICNIVAAYATVENAGDWFVCLMHGDAAPDPIYYQAPAGTRNRAWDETSDKPLVREAYHDGYRISLSLGVILKHYRVGCDDEIEPYTYNGAEVDHYKVLCVDSRIYHSMSPSYRGTFGTKQEVYAALSAFEQKT
jgi:hypothetical protein